MATGKGILFMIVTIYINIADFWKLKKKEILGHYICPEKAEKLMERKILPVIGMLRLSEITVSDLECFFRQLREGGLLVFNQQLVKAMLRRLFQLAVEARLMKNNPVDALATIPDENRELRGLTPEQETALLYSFNFTSQPELYTLILITGLPFRELAGCRKEDFLQKEGRLRLWRNVLYRGILEKPDREKRTVPLSEPALRIFRLLADGLERDDEPFFHDKEGGMLTQIPCSDYAVIRRHSDLPETIARDWVHNFGIRAL